MFREPIFTRWQLLAFVAALAVLAARGDALAGFRTLLSFDGGAGGANPYYAPLVRDAANGNLYGTTAFGGDPSCQCGVVFQLAPDGTETVLHAFVAGGDGSNPFGGVIRDRDGNIFGTTYFGGSGGAGVVFQIAPDGIETLLHSFDYTDGASPVASLVMSKSGVLYGTTQISGPNGEGTVFEIAEGSFFTLYSFGGRVDDGELPQSALIIDSNGRLVGTAYEGGLYGEGDVFRVSGKGNERAIYPFSSGSDGNSPNAAVIEDSLGNLIGTTEGGGDWGAGTIYKITPDGSESVLFSFGKKGGAFPDSSLVEDSSGNLYGTASSGGDANCDCGTVYKLAPDGTFTVLHKFKGGTEGAFPYAGLIAGKKGHLYGVTGFGGTNNAGTVFELDE